MALNRRLADRELVCDLFVAVTSGNQPDYVDFTFSQLVIGGVIRQLNNNF